MKRRVIISGPAETDVLSNHQWWTDNRSEEQAVRWLEGIYNAMLGWGPRRLIFTSLALECRIRQCVHIYIKDFFLATIATLLLVICVALFVRGRNEHMISTESALQTAKEYAIKILESDLSTMEATMEIQSTVKWSTIEFYFYPTTGVLGGDLRVVIDRKNGKVISSIAGQ